MHYHVATGLAGYGPDGADGFASFGSLDEALEFASAEIGYFIDYANESAHAFADAGQFQDAWNEVVRCESLEILRANLASSRRSAPLYVDNGAAWVELRASQLAEFPHDVSANTRLYLWECEESDETCEHWQEDAA